jgi:hypothetical protein
MVCPFCAVVSVLPHESQQACIQALETEIERTRQVLGCRTEPLIAGTVRHDLRRRRTSASSGGKAEDEMRVSVRCTLDR